MGGLLLSYGYEHLGISQTREIIMKTKRLQLMIMATLFLGVNIGGASIAQHMERRCKIKVQW